MKGKNLLNESTLLARIADGDEIAFRQVFDHFHPKILGFAEKITRSNADAEEVVQDIFLKVWFGRNQLATVDNFGAYLNRLVRNHAFNLLRHEAVVSKAKNEITLATSEADFGTQQSLDYNEAKELLENVVNKLPEQQRRVYALCQLEGLKYNEAATQLNISPDTVHYHMKLALNTIREHFRRHSLACLGLSVFFLK